MGEFTRKRNKNTKKKVNKFKYKYMYIQMNSSYFCFYTMSNVSIVKLLYNEPNQNFNSNRKRQQHRNIISI